MEFPLESLVTTAIEQISTGVQLKVSQIEEQRNREFTYQLKELEFYKSNYDKDLKKIFDYWFDLVRVTHIKDNKNLDAQDRTKFLKKYNELISISKIAEYKMNTLKYGGPETGRILALESTLHNKKYEKHPSNTPLFVWCTVLSVLKKEILGQITDPIDIIRVLVNDLYDNDNYDKLMDGKKFAVDLYKELYNEKPYWAWGYTVWAWMKAFWNEIYSNNINRKFKYELFEKEQLLRNTLIDNLAECF